MLPQGVFIHVSDIPASRTLFIVKCDMMHTVHKVKMYNSLKTKIFIYLRASERVIACTCVPASVSWGVEQRQRERERQAPP